MYQTFLGKGKKHFNWNNALDVEYLGSNLEDCRIKLNNSFSKILPENKVAVFGDYVTYILYYSISRDRKIMYHTKSRKAEFYDIIPCESVNPGSRLTNGDNIDIKLDFSFTPPCKCNFTVTQKENLIYASWKIQYEGEINVSIYKTDDSTDADGEAEIKGARHTDRFAGNNFADGNMPKGKVPRENGNAVVRSINEDLNIPVNMLLEMDPHQLEQVSEDMNPFPTDHKIE